ncbi:unnamed protein product [Rotaria sp. Silwood1]|nr:unnamed protein product [Rotaria sp. Silwood1]CAF4884664.1 unnamed protein product [Rotaria sp. Silwood1]
MLFPASVNPMDRGVALGGTGVAWTNGVVPYEIASGYNSAQETFIIAAMEKLERLIAINNVQCIRFRPRISSDPYYITIVRGSGCSSYVSFFHEQSRPDRDEYITVYYENIRPGMEHNFVKFNNSFVDTLNTSYDYASVMHYPANAFSVNNRSTIVPLQPNVTIGQRVNLSSIDILEVRILYNCPTSGVTLPPTTTTTTSNE